MKMLHTYLLAAFLVGFSLTLQLKGTIAFAQGEAIKPFLLNPAPSYSVLPSRVGMEGRGKPTIKEVQDYFKAIFGNAWKTAWAVSQNECSTKRPEWPNCLNSWGIKGSNKGEFSVGILQINIARESGKGAFIHWNKIPGANLDQKQAYLMDWKNNILIAHVIYTQSGFNPWTGYHMLQK